MVKNGIGAYFKTRRPLHPVTGFTRKLATCDGPDTGHRFNDHARIRRITRSY